MNESNKYRKLIKIQFLLNDILLRQVKSLSLMIYKMKAYPFLRHTCLTLLIYYLIAFALSFSSLIYYDYTMSKNKSVNQGELFKQLVVETVKPHLLMEDMQGLKKSLDALILQGFSQKVCIYDVSGKSLFSSFSTAVVSDCSNISSEIIENGIWYREEIKLSDRVLASVWVGKQSNNFTDYFEQRSGILVLLMVFVLLLTLWVYLHLKHTLSSPLLETSKFYRMMANKMDFSKRINTSGPSELKDLNEAFNNLLESFEKSQIQLKDIAYNDPLTCLPNRRNFWEYLNVAMHSLNRSSKSIALLLIDLDDFKFVNDEYGHQVGDEVLRTISLVMRTCVRQEDFLARIGGDEFILVLKDCEGPQVPKKIAQKIISALDRQFVIEQKEVRVGASIGISLSPDDTRETSELVRLADKAMYFAKKKGKNSFLFWNDSFDQLCDAVEEDESKILEVMEHGLLELKFLPQYDFSGSKSIVGAKVIPYYSRLPEGSKSVEEIMSQSESQRFLMLYNEWFFRELSHHIKVWDKAKVLDKVIPVTIELLPHKVHLACFIQAFKYFISQSGIKPEFVVIQLDELSLNRLHNLSLDVIAFEENMDFLYRSSLSLVLNGFSDAYTVLNKASNVLVKRIQLSASDFLSFVSEKSTAHTLSKNVFLHSEAKSIIDCLHRFDCKMLVSDVQDIYTWKEVKALKADLVQGPCLSEPLSARAFMNQLLASSENVLRLNNLSS